MSSFINLLTAKIGNLFVTNINGNPAGDVSTSPTDANIFYYLTMVKNATGLQTLYTDDSPNYLSYNPITEILYVKNELQFNDTDAYLGNEVGTLDINPTSDLTLIPGGDLYFGNTIFPITGGITGQVLTLSDDTTAIWENPAFSKEDIIQMKEEIKELKLQIKILMDNK